jgi:hypothetical protein
MSERLPKPESEYDEYEWAVQPRPNWRLATGKECRSRLTSAEAGGDKYAYCHQPSVAEINRGHHGSIVGRVDNWWGYCERHLTDYGNWIEDGQVVSWMLREKSVPADGSETTEEK